MRFWRILQCGEPSVRSGEVQVWTDGVISRQIKIRLQLERTSTPFSLIRILLKWNIQKRLIRNAGFDQPEANIMDINYTSGRKLNRYLINRFATCEYISEHRNLFITGATGCGKTYMSCAFGMEAHVSSITIPGMSVCRMCLRIQTVLARRKLIVK